MKKIGILIQARLSSSRFPSKMLHMLGDIPLVEFVYRRCCLSRLNNIVAVVTSNETSDDVLYEYCKKHEMPVFRGSLNDVLERYIDASDCFNLDYVVRVCGDSPFVDAESIDTMIGMVLQHGYDYIALDSSKTFPGFISEIIDVNILKRIRNITDDKNDHEHVTKYILEHSGDFKTESLQIPVLGYDQSMPKLTIDYPEDMALVNELIKLGNLVFSSKVTDITSMLLRM